MSGTYCSSSGINISHIFSIGNNTRLQTSHSSTSGSEGSVKVDSSSFFVMLMIGLLFFSFQALIFYFID